ncbi:MAG: hypothetical protein WCQ53_08680, partial [bacterium]
MENMTTDVYKDFLSKLVQEEDEIKKQLNTRRKPYEEKNEKKALKEELLSDGWEVVKEFKTTYKYRKQKSFHQYFQDRLWCLAAMMGFSTLNNDNYLLLPCNKNTSIPGRQVDVLAADDETVLIIECKSCKEETSKSMQNVINDFNTIKEGSFVHLRSIFGDRKVKFILATENIVLNENDKKRLEEFNGITYFNEQDIAYYEQLVAQIGHAAKYQLLG